MTKHHYDAILFLRLAGTLTGVRARHIPETLIATVADLGACVSFRRDRVFVRDAGTVLHRLLNRSWRSPSV